MTGCQLDAEGQEVPTEAVGPPPPPPRPCRKPVPLLPPPVPAVHGDVPLFDLEEVPRAATQATQGALF